MRLQTNKGHEKPGVIKQPAALLRSYIVLVEGKEYRRNRRHLLAVPEPVPAQRSVPAFPEFPPSPPVTPQDRHQRSHQSLMPSSSLQGRLSDPNLGQPRQMFLCPEITMLKGHESSSPGLEEFQDRTQSSKTLSLDNLRTELYLTIQGPDLLTIEIAL